jgi:hypothetical protein
MSTSNDPNHRMRILTFGMFLLGWALIATAAAEFVWGFVRVIKLLGPEGNIEEPISWLRVSTFVTILLAALFALVGADDEGGSSSRPTTTTDFWDSAVTCGATTGTLLFATVLLWFNGSAIVRFVAPLFAASLLLLGLGFFVDYAWRRQARRFPRVRRQESADSPDVTPQDGPKALARGTGVVH